jgi:hypothetical protein
MKSRESDGRLVGNYCVLEYPLALMLKKRRLVKASLTLSVNMPLL